MHAALKVRKSEISSLIRVHPRSSVVPPAFSSPCLRGESPMPHEFSITHTVQFSETDMAGVVHFSNYFRWMEEVEHAFFRSLGLSIVMTSEAIELGWPRVAASCEYLGPARFEDDITLDLRVQRIGDKSLTY